MADISDLTIRELNVIGREIGADPLGAVAEGTEHRWTALALTLWLLDRRTRPDLHKEPYLELTVADIEQRYGDDQAPETEEEPDPTAPEPSP